MHTIYDLTEAERATMKKLIDMGLVVTIGAHAAVKKSLAEAEADAKVGKEFADLWYFAMDSAPGEFERIVTTHSPKLWMHKIAAVRRGERL